MINNDQFYQTLLEEHKAASACPSPHLVIEWFDKLLGLLFAEFSEQEFKSKDEIAAFGEGLKHTLKGLLLRSKMSIREDADQVVDDFFQALPVIRQRLLWDVVAMYEGDPAARSNDEVIRTYPGFYAIAAHRLAHQLHHLKVELIPRIISEHAHSKTGIDIHPGATIGDYFCIDHGTGIVIGETTQIGQHVKIYQGVTLGALSVKKSDASTKRHPTIEDNVVIYAGASILGGKTVIGQNSIIGGNVWLTDGVPANSKVYYQAKMSHKEGEPDVITYNS
ncbi:MAG: serine O-acetyltransferase EpsC [Bacteroidota bacterium]